jgi:hypothetical protein
MFVFRQPAIDVLTVIMPELEFRDVQRQVLAADLVINQFRIFRTFA